MERIQARRLFFANLITANAGLPPDSELASAFASTPRENFVEPPPWKIFAGHNYMETPSDDPACFYQDVVVSLGSQGPLNNGQPTLHAFCIAALDPRKGERVVHIGAGTGYYTTLLAKLVGETGVVDAFEIEPTVAQRATSNLAEFPHVNVHHRSGAVGPLPKCDVLCVNAGATHPLAVWLDTLRPNGRLILPLTPQKDSEPCSTSRNTEKAATQLVFYWRHSLFPASAQGMRQPHKSSPYYSAKKTGQT